MSEFKIFATVYLEPWQLANSLAWDYDKLVQFVVGLDREIADSVFTDDLIAKLKENSDG